MHAGMHTRSLHAALGAFACACACKPCMHAHAVPAYQYISSVCMCAAVSARTEMADIVAATEQLQPPVIAQEAAAMFFSTMTGQAAAADALEWQVGVRSCSS